MKPFITILILSIIFFSCKKASSNSLQSSTQCYYVTDCSHNLLNEICGLSQASATDSMKRETGYNSSCWTLVNANSY